MSEGATLGSLLLELGIDPTGYDEGLDKARMDAIELGKEIEASLKHQLPTLTPKVDDSALTRLNKHLDLKQRHFTQVNQYMKANPLTPRVDFSQLNELEKRLNKIKNGNYSPRVGATGAVSGGGSGGSKNNDRQLADQIGRAVAQNSRPNIAERAIRTVGGLAAKAVSVPGKIVGKAVGGAVEGLMLGATQEVSRNLGKGLSSALENAVSKSFGSTELIGERIGGAVGNALLQNFQGKVEGIPKVLEQAIDKIQDGKLRSRLKKVMAEAKEIPDALRSQAIETLGGEQAIAGEGLYQRGKQQQNRSSRQPASQKQAVREWRQTLKAQDAIEATAAAAMAESDQKLARASQIAQRHQAELQRLQAEMEAAAASGNGDKVSQMQPELKQAATRAAGLAHEVEQTQEFQAHISESVARARGKTRAAYARVKAVTPEQTQPKAFVDLVRQTVGRDLSPEQMPTLRVADGSLKKAGALSQYDAARNSIEVTRKTFEQIKKNALTPKQVEMLKEEIEHGVDVEFGSYKGIQAMKDNRITTKRVAPTSEEFAQIAPELGLYSPDRRALELNAKVKAKRGMSAYEQSQHEKNLLDVVPTLATNKPAIGNRQKEFQGQLGQLQKFAADAGNDVSGSIAKYEAFFKVLQTKIEELADEILANPEDLDPAAINAKTQKMGAYWSSVEGLSDKVKASTVDQIDLIQQQRSQPVPLNLPLHTPDRSLEMVEVLQAAEAKHHEAIQAPLNIPQAAAQGKASAEMQQGAKQQAQAIDHQVKATQQAAKATRQTAKTIDHGADSIASKAVAQAKKLDANFASAYQELQKAIADGNHEAAQALNLTIQDMAKKGKASLDKFSVELKAQGEEMGFGSELSSLLGQVKGRLTQKSKLAKKNTSKFEQARSEQGEDLTAQSLSLDAISGGTKATASKFAHSVDESLNALDELAAKLHKTATHAQAHSIPGRSTIAAMDGKQLAQAKAQMQARLAAHDDAEASGEDLTAQHRFGRGLNPNQKRLNPAEKVFIEETIKTLEHAEAAWRRYGQVVGQVEKQVTEREAAANAGLEKALNPDAKEWEERIQKRIAEMDKTIAELDQGYSDRLDNSQQSLNEHLEHRQAYAEMMGVDPDSAQAMAITPPKPKEDGFFKALMDDTAELPEKLGKLGGMAKTAVLGFAGFAGVSFVAPMLKDIADQCLDVATQMEQVGQTFAFAYGSIAAGNTAMEHTRSTAKALGNDMKSALAGQSQLSMVSKGTSLEGYGVESIGDSMQQANSVSSLTGEQQNRAYLATSQMIGKGKVQAEELRGQLSEIGGLYGKSFQIMADAIGVTTQELDGMLQRGEVMSQDVLPKFFAQMSAESATGLPTAAKSSQAAISNLDNAILELQETAGKPLLPARNMGFNLLADGIGIIKNLSGVIIELMGAAAIVAIGSFIKGIAGGAKSLNLLEMATSGVQKGGAALKSFFTQGANGAAGWTVGIVGAIEVLKIFGKAFSDSGGKAREFATQATESLEKYRKELAETKQQGTNVPAPTTGQQFGDTGESLLEGTMLGGLIGKNNARGLERGAQQFLGQFDEATGLKAGSTTTYGQLQGQQQSIARGDAITASNNVLQEMQNRLTQYKGGVDGGKGSSGPLAQLKSINDQVEATQNQRRSLLPGDKAGAERLNHQEDDLNRQRQPLDREVRGLTAQNAAAIAAFKGLRDEALAKGDTKAVAEYEQQLDAATKMQDRFNAIIGKTPDILGKLERGFGAVQAALEKTNMEMERSAAASRKTLASAQIAGGMSPGELDFARTQADQQNMQGKMGANSKAIDQSTNLLNSPDILKALKDSKGLTGIDSPDQINPTLLRSQIAGMEDSQQKDLLTQAANQKEAIDTKTTENGNLGAQLEESKAQAVQKLRDLATQVYDFYRGIEQSAKEIQLTAQSSALQAKTQMGQAKLKSALTGFQESFINDFIESLIGMVEALNKPLESAMGAQQQILAAQNQYIQQVQQAYQMQQQLPSIAQVAGQQAPLPGMLPQPSQAQDGAANVPVLGQPGSTPGMTVPQAMPGTIAPGAMPGSTSIPGVSPSQVSGPLNQLQQMNPMQATTFGQQGLQSAVGLAGQNYQTSVETIQRQQEAQQFMAGVEARNAASNASHQLYQAGRRMDDTVRGNRRGLEDLQSANQIQTPDIERQSRFRGIDRDFEDKRQSYGDTMRGLTQTVQQAEQAKATLIEGMARGLFPPAFQQQVNELSNTIDRTHGRIVETTSQIDALNQAEQQARNFAAAEEKRKEGDRQFGIGQKASEGQIALYGAQAAQARNSGNGSIARGLDYRGQVTTEGNRSAQITHDLQEQLALGQLTTKQYQEQLETEKQLHATNLANLEVDRQRTEEDARRQIQSRRVSLGNGLLRAQAQGDRLDGRSTRADDREYRANLNEGRQAIRDQLHDLQEIQRTVGMTTQEYRAQHDLIVATGQQNERNLGVERDRNFRNKGGLILTGQDITKEREATGAIQQAEKRGTASLAQTVAMGNDNNKFFDVVLSHSNRDYVSKLADLMDKGGFQGKTQAQALGDQFDSGQISQSDLGAKLDQLLAAFERGSSRPNLSITNVDDVATAGQIFSDISRGNMRNAGI